MPCFKISRISLIWSVAGGVGSKVTFTLQAMLGVPKQQHECLAQPVIAPNIDPQHPLRGILGGLLCYFVCSRDALADRLT
jgi:hypothetical protein